MVRNKNPVMLGARKGTNIPGAVLDLPALTERDKRVRKCVEVGGGGIRVERGLLARMLQCAWDGVLWPD